MSQDLPIFSDSAFRGSDPFASLERAKGMELGPSLERFDSLLDHGEDAASAGPAREALTGPTARALCQAHERLFPGRAGAGELRESKVAGLYPGQDCPEPEFIAASLANLETWLAADSFHEIHPVEQAALAITRLVDIWPFAFGNRTAAVVFSNQFLLAAGYPPFFVLAGQAGEIEEILSAAIRMDTAPLVRAIYKCLERELELAGR